MFRRFSRHHNCGVNDAGQFDLQLQGPILVFLPEEAILVDTHSSDEGNNQALRTAYLHVICAEIRMLPQDAVILFMHANSIGEHHYFAAIVGHHCIEIVNRSQAVAAEFQGVS